MRESIGINPEEREVVWMARAERFIERIDTEIEKNLQHSPDGNEHSLYLDTLKSEIQEIFSGYENKNMNIPQVENDLKFRIEQAEEDSEEKRIYKDILALVQVRGTSF
jgi:hypothetical protein